MSQQCRYHNHLHCAKVLQPKNELFQRSVCSLNHNKQRRLWLLDSRYGSYFHNVQLQLYPKFPKLMKFHQQLLSLLLFILSIFLIHGSWGGKERKGYKKERARKKRKTRKINFRREKKEPNAAPTVAVTFALNLPWRYLSTKQVFPEKKKEFKKSSFSKKGEQKQKRKQTNIMLTKKDNFYINFGHLQKFSLLVFFLSLSSFWQTKTNKKKTKKKCTESKKLKLWRKKFSFFRIGENIFLAVAIFFWVVAKN